MLEEQDALTILAALGQEFLNGPIFPQLLKPNQDQLLSQLDQQFNPGDEV